MLSQAYFNLQYFLNFNVLWIISVYNISDIFIALMFPCFVYLNLLFGVGDIGPSEPLDDH